MQLSSVSLIINGFNSHQFASNINHHFSERIMAHCSAFFTAILFLLCALLIEQIALAQNYGQLFGTDDYDYGLPGGRGGGGGGAGLDHDSGGEGDEDEGDMYAPPGVGGGDDGAIENEGDAEGGAVAGEDYPAGEDYGNGGDEGGGEGDEGEQGQLDPEEEEDINEHKAPKYSEYMYGGQRNRLHQVPLIDEARSRSRYSSAPDRHTYRSSPSSGALGSINRWGPSYVNPRTMPTLPPPSENYDEYDEDTAASSVSPLEHNDYDEENQIEKPHQQQRQNEVHQTDYSNQNPQRRKPSNTLVTVQEGNSKQGNFRWRIVASMSENRNKYF